MKNLFKLIIILCIGYGSYFGVVNDEGEKVIDMTNVEEQQVEQQNQNNTIENLVQETQKEKEQEQGKTYKEEK